MTSRRNDERNHSTLRTLAATVGTIPVALMLAIALTLALPLPGSLRLSIGWYAIFPLWVSAACMTFLAPSARRAWLLLLTALGLAALVSLIALGLGRGQPPSLGR